MTFTINYTTPTNATPVMLQGRIHFEYGEGADWHNRKASTTTAIVQVLVDKNWRTITLGVSKMVADNNDPDFGRELAIWRALENIAPTGRTKSVNLFIDNEDATTAARTLRIAVWEAWRTRRGDGEIAPVKDSTRKAWREYRAWVREHGRGQTSNQLAQTA